MQTWWCFPKFNIPHHTHRTVEDLKLLFCLFVYLFFASKRQTTELGNDMILTGRWNGFFEMWNNIIYNVVLKFLVFFGVSCVLRDCVHYTLVLSPSLGLLVLKLLPTTPFLIFKGKKKTDYKQSIFLRVDKNTYEVYFWRF